VAFYMQKGYILRDTGGFCVPIKRSAQSLMALSIVGSIKDFIAENAAAMSDSATVDEGVDVIAEAIAYGIAKGFSDSTIANAFLTGGNIPPSGNPLAGQVLHTAIANVTTEP
jgi:hypothetical protein